MQLGILLNNLGPSQLAYLTIKNINSLTNTRPDIDSVIFYENFFKPCLPVINTAFMDISESWNYNGIIVATSIGNANKLLSFPGPKNKFFYVWDLEWIRQERKHFRHFQNVYGNSNLQLIARSPEHSRLISECWNVSYVPVVDDFNIYQLIEVVENGIK